MSTLSPPAATLPRERLTHALLRLLLVAALPLLWQLAPRYEAAGVLVAPLSPALALALCAAAGMGWRALPALVLGAALAACGWPLALPHAPDIADAVVLVLQAGFGGLLLRRSSQPDTLALDNAAAIRRLVAVALACGLAGALSEVAFDLIWSSSPSARPVVLALVRGLADAATVLLLAPVLLALAAPSWLRWRPRWRSVALPLGLLAVLLLLAFAGVDERDRQQAQARFERDAELVYARVQAQLDLPQQAVLALQGAALAGGGALTPTLFDSVARPWFARSAGLASMGWLELPARADAGGELQLRHRLAASASMAGGDEVLAAALRPALQKALLQDGPLVSPPLAIGDAREARNGFVILQALPALNGGATRALLFATVLADPLVMPVLASRSDALRACLIDLDPQAGRRLSGGGGCDGQAMADGGFVREADFLYGGRRWQLRVSQPLRTPGGVWLFALPALAGSAVLAVLLLAVAGRVQRAQSAAREQSDSLRGELAHWREAQSHSEQLLQALLDTVQVGAALLDRDGRVQRANAAFAELVGLTPAALLRQPIDELLAENEAAPGAHRRIAGRLQSGGGELLHETLQLHGSHGGPTRPVLVTLRLLEGGGHHDSAAVCAVHDLSDHLRRRQAEKVLDDVLERARLGERTVAEATASAPMPLNRLASAAPQRLLCIQPAADSPQALVRLLAGQPGLQLAQAGGADGLARAAAEQPHLVLLDLDLADADGLDLLRALGEHPATRSIPVIAVAADPRPDRIDAAFAAGARAYLTRPLEPRQLLAAIAEQV